jgi:hypothetical protein
MMATWAKSTSSTQDESEVAEAPPVGGAVGGCGMAMVVSCSTIEAAIDPGVDPQLGAAVVPMALTVDSSGGMYMEVVGSVVQSDVVVQSEVVVRSVVVHSVEAAAVVVSELKLEATVVVNHSVI